MTKFILSILVLFFFQQTPYAFNGEKRLSKKNIVSIQSNNDASLLLNDQDGNVFNYNGSQVIQFDFINNIDAPTRIHSTSDEEILYSNGNSLFLKKEGQAVKEILSVPQFESIAKLVENKDFYFVSTLNGLYEVEKSSGVVDEIYKNNVEKTDKLICGNNDCYVALKNIVINLSKDNLVEHNLPGNISGLQFHPEHGLLSLSDDRIFVSSKEGSRKLFPTIGVLPEGIINICGSKRWLFLITENSVSVFDWLNAEVKHLGTFNGYQIASHIDQWDNLWLSTNQGIWNFSGYNNFESPRVIDIEVTDKNNNPLVATPLTFNAETSLVNITPKIVYLPNTENLVNEWRIGDGDWRPFVRDFALSEKMIADGNNKLFIRSKSNESSYSQPYKLDIKNSINSSKIPPIWYAILGLIGSLLVVSLISLFNIRTKQNADSLQIEKLECCSRHTKSMATKWQNFLKRILI